MTQTLIVHCPNCPAIENYLREVTRSLEADDVIVATEGGKRGEFAVLVNGKRVVDRPASNLPPVDDVRTAVRHERQVGRFAKPHSWI